MAPKNRSFGSWHAVSYAFTRCDRRLGFTLVEILLVIIILGVASAIAVPPIGRMRVTASVQNARSSVISVVSLGRATAMNYGRPATVHLDSDADRVLVEVDTTLAGDGSAVDTLGLLHLNDGLRVDLRSNRSAVCFDSQGIGTTNDECPVGGAQIILSLSDKADTVTVTTLGRISG